MARKATMRIKKHMTVEKLKKQISRLEMDVRILNRLHFINDIYHGMTVPQASAKAGIDKVTGYSWLKRWNNKGYDGLKPDYGIGRPSKISNEQKQKMKELIVKNNIKTTKEVKNLIKNEFQVEYSDKQVTVILRELGFK
ncbi:MAG: IS630 family transposase [Methanobrevibacter sp. CfCl-M3]